MNVQRFYGRSRQGGDAPRPSWLLRAIGALFTAASWFLILAMLAASAEARVGGGSSYSGGSSHSGGGGGGGGILGTLIFDLIWYLLRLAFRYPTVGVPVLILIVAWLVYVNRTAKQTPSSYSSSSSRSALEQVVTGAPVDVPASFDRLRKYDPNFSEITFTDFVYTLYARAHEARGRGDLETFSPYLSPAARASLVPVPPAIKEVTGIIVGGMTILGVTDPDSNPRVSVNVQFQTNYTEIDAAGKPESYYAEEEWTFTRLREILSPAPEMMTALHCPRCGGALELKPDGSCAFCGVKVAGGDFHWFVESIQLGQRETRGPLLTQDVPEQGTDLPTLFQPDFEAVRQRFMQANPDFAWPRAEERFQYIFMQLQDAWSSLHWEKARPFETDNLFQMHQYWIEAYRKQRLHNVLEDVKIETIQVVKVQSDIFYNAITVRIFASMIDYTEDAQQKVVCGSKTRPRRFSEYWTFIRRKGAAESKQDNASCPNCGAPLKINMAGSCEFCGGKVASGNFDWVLSRIEQDEAYRG